MGGAMGDGMEATFFAMKRGYYATLRYSWGQLKGTGVTPARLDLMRCIRDASNSVVQCALWERLGVARSTMSRMLGSLERLGLVRRDYTSRRRRSAVCSLTDRGKQVVNGILERLVEPGVVARAVSRALGPYARRVHRFARIAAARLSHAFVGKGFGCERAYWGSDDIRRSIEPLNPRAFAPIRSLAHFELVARLWEALDV
jgi:DNA-binding MarR family transcriptional regulator